MPKILYKFLRCALLAAAVLSCTNTGSSRKDSDTAPAATAPGITAWLTDPSAGILFKEQKDLVSFGKGNAGEPEIIIDERKEYQTIDGFGYTLTGGSALHLHQMDTAARAALLRELFSTMDAAIGVSYLRISIGASDLDAEPFSYDDLPPGERDDKMEKFSIARDKIYLIPVLKEILAISPSLKILGSPWSPPVWMKTNKSSIGGSLKPEYYDAYARYFVKYIRAMQAEGIVIDAITIQNEPLHPGNNPSMLMPAKEQAGFIRESLGPAFKAAGITTKILIYDHNADRPDYPLTVLNDPEAAQYIDGSAFHLYGGTIDTLSSVHNAHPGKNLYFTEQWIGAPGNLKEDLVWHTKNVIIGAMRNWCRIALEWNLASNTSLTPHTPGGCTACLGAVTIDSNNVRRNPAYYIIAHAAKVIRPGAVRIQSSQPLSLPNAAFQLPGGKKAMIVLNESEKTIAFHVRQGEKAINTSLAGGAVVTFSW